MLRAGHPHVARLVPPPLNTPRGRRYSAFTVSLGASWVPRSCLAPLRPALDALKAHPTSHSRVRLRPRRGGVDTARTAQIGMRDAEGGHPPLWAQGVCDGRRDQGRLPARLAPRAEALAEARVLTRWRSRNAAGCGETRHNRSGQGGCTGQHGATQASTAQSTLLPVLRFRQREISD